MHSIRGRKLGYGVLLGLLATSAIVQAREVRVYPPEGVQVFLGLDDTSAPTQVQDGRAQDLQNVMLGISRDLRQRGGNQTIGADTLDTPGQGRPTVTGLYYTKFSSGTERIVSVTGGVFRYLDGSTWQQVTGQNVGISASQNNQFVWTTALDEIIGTNDSDKPLRYDATNVNEINFSGLASGNVPSRAKVVAFFKNFLVFGNTVEGGTARTTRVRWSNVGTTTTWTDADFVDVAALGGQTLNCFGELYDNLYIGFTNSIYRMSFVGGSGTFQFAQVSNQHGCEAKGSMRQITLGNGQTALVFLDRDKEIQFLDGVSVRPISTLIKTTMGTLRGSRLQYAVSATTNMDYLLCTTTGSANTINNLCLDFQLEIGEWTKHTNVNANAMATVVDGKGDTKIYFGTDKGFIYEFDETLLKDDVGGVSGGTVDAVNGFATTTSSGLTVLYDAAMSATTGALVGAPIKLTGGAGVGLTNIIASNTSTGVVVVDTFSTAPNSTTTFEVGAIDSFYTTKWYDFGRPANLKQLAEFYFWADSDVASTISVSVAKDFQSNVSTKSESLASSSNSVWGTGLWGTAVWGAGKTIFVQSKLEAEGRFQRYQFSEDDPGQSFHLYGWVPLLYDMEVW